MNFYSILIFFFCFIVFKYYFLKSEIKKLNRRYVYGGDEVAVWNQKRQIFPRKNTSN